jgi:Secretion system C-terminal sorting domain
MKQKRGIIVSWKLVINKLLLLLWLSSPAVGQVVNIVPDPSFEDTTAVVDWFTSHALKQWQNLDSGNFVACRSVYMSFTTPQLPIRLPANQWVFQLPRFGNGMVMLENQYLTAPFEFNRSLAKCKLKQCLVIGKTYYAKLHCVPGERTYSHFSDGISMYFDNGQLDTMVSIKKDSTGIYPQVVPQVINPYGNVITDTVNWTKIEGCFVANGTETYLTIGNFKSNANTALLPNPNGGSPTTSGMLIDDVSVYPIDLANWLPATYTYTLGDSATIGLPNYETPDAKWYTYNMQLIDSGSQIKVLPLQSGTKYICGIDMCNTVVYDTVTVLGVPLLIENGKWKVENVVVFPNPASSVLKISTTTLAPSKFSIYNMQGSLVHSGNLVNGVSQLSILGWASGQYFVRVGGKTVAFVKE